MNTQQIPVPTPLPIATPMPTLTYLSGAACGVSFQYPNTLTPIESSSSGVVLTDMTSPESSVILVCQQDIPRIPLTPDLIDAITLKAASGTATVSALLYHDTSPNDGAKIDKLIFTHPKTTMDVFVAGYGSVYQQLISTIKILN